MPVRCFLVVLLSSLMAAVTPLSTQTDSATFSGCVTDPRASSTLGSSFSSRAGFNPIFNTGGPQNFQFALKVFF